MVVTYKYCSTGPDQGREYHSFIHSLHEYYYSVISLQASRTLNIVSIRRNSKLCGSLKTYIPTRSLSQERDLAKRYVFKWRLKVATVAESVAKVSRLESKDDAWCQSVFGHVRRLPEQASAHAALRLAVYAHSGRKLDNRQHQWQRSAREKDLAIHVFVRQRETAPRRYDACQLNWTEPIISSVFHRFFSNAIRKKQLNRKDVMAFKNVSEHRSGEFRL